MFFEKGDNFKQLAYESPVNVIGDLIGKDALHNFYPDEFGKSKKWMQVVNEFLPVVKIFKENILKQADNGRELTDTEAEILNNIIYDGSQMYNEGPQAFRKFVRLYIMQLDILSDILKDRPVNKSKIDKTFSYITSELD